MSDGQRTGASLEPETLIMSVAFVVARDKADDLERSAGL